MAGDGRKIKVPNAGHIEFAESTATGTNKGKLQTTNLTGDYVWTLPNKSCNLGGLGPGETYPVSAGGTGVGSIGFGQIPYGSGLEYMNLSPAPTNANTFFGWDGVGLRFAPINIGPNGEVNTLLSTGSGAQVNRSKLGSEIQIRSLRGGNAIVVTQNLDEIVFDLNMGAYNGVIPVTQGGTGIQVVSKDDIILGGDSNTFARLAKPSAANMVLRRNLSNTGYEWVDKGKLLTGMLDHLSGQFDPTLDPNSLTAYMPYRYKLKALHHAIASGSAVYTLKVGTTTIKTGTVNNANLSAIDLVQNGTYPTFEVGTEITLTFTNLNEAQRYKFTLVLERVAAGD